MARLLLFLVSLAIISTIAYFYVTTSPRNSHTAEPPAQALQNVRESAKNIEQDTAQRAADIDHKAGNVP